MSDQNPPANPSKGDSPTPLLPIVDAGGPWYRDGLRFTCTQCGDCCTGAPGYVWVNEEEIRQIAEVLNKPIGEIRLMHTKRVGRDVSLREHANGDCTFFDGATRRCTIYTVRPRQCRTWPFWNSNLESPDSWKAVTQVCPGSGKGKLHDRVVIEAQASIVDV